jgi:archaemetzincin
MKINPWIFVFVCLLAISCGGNGTADVSAGKRDATPDKKPVAQTTPIVIVVQPFADISASMTDYVVSELKKIYPKVELKTAIDLPETAYYKARNRYRADSLLNFLASRTQLGHIVIALTTKDISCTNDGIPDWGVIGLGFCPGNACVVSTFRLSKSNTLEQLFKASIHELGHTQGLDHCPNKSCFMRDAEGKNTTDEENDFCPKCKAYLQGRGWVFGK